MGKLGKVIELDNDTWEVIGVGVEAEGKIYVHLASKTRGKQNKNGFYPAQRCCFVDLSLLA